MQFISNRHITIIIMNACIVMLYTYHTFNYITTSIHTDTHKDTSGGDPMILSTSDPRCSAKPKTSFGTLHLQKSTTICTRRGTVR